MTGFLLPCASCQNDECGGVHQLDAIIDGTSVRDILQQKLPAAEPVGGDAIMDGPPLLEPHPIFFNAIDQKVVKQATVGTSGAAGPSGVDVDGWRHMCSSFTDVSRSLCNALYWPCVLSGWLQLMSSRNQWWHIPRVASFHWTRALECSLLPIGIGEVMRRIIGKAILSVAGGACS
eukprot:scpid84452/ scgid19639/ 